MKLQRWIWLLMGHVALALGVIGIFIPLLPTTPFLLLAAYWYSKGSSRFEHWLVTHPRLGPPILEWRQHRVIRRKAKWIGGLSILFSLLLILVTSSIPILGKISAGLVLVSVLSYVWTRPEAVPLKEIE